MYRRSRWVVEGQWAAALREAGQIPAAIEHNRHALSIAEALSRNAPQSAQYHADIGSAERKLSESLLVGSDFIGACDHAERSRATFCDAAETASDVFTQANCGRALLALGNALLSLNKLQPAVERYRAAEQTARKLSQPHAVNAI